MDYDSSTKFISSLAKFLQSLCNGYVEFDNGVQVIGHIYLSVDTGKTIDYILNEKVCKTDENSVTFISNSFHAQPAERPKPPGKRGAKDKSDMKIEDDENGTGDQVEPRSTNHGTVPSARNAGQNSPIGGKRPFSPSQRQQRGDLSPSKSGRLSPRHKKSRTESFEQISHISNPASENSISSAPSPAGDDNPQNMSSQGADVQQGSAFNESYPQTFFHPADDDNSIGEPDRDIKPSLDTDVTFIKEEYNPSSCSQSGSQGRDRSQGEDSSMYPNMFPTNQSYTGTFPTQSGYVASASNSQRSNFNASADRSSLYSSGAGSSQLEPGENTGDPSGSLIIGSERRRGSHGSSSVSGFPPESVVSSVHSNPMAWPYRRMSCPSNSVLNPIQSSGSSHMSGMATQHASRLSRDAFGNPMFTTCSKCGGKYTNPITCANHEASCTGHNRLMCHICKRVYSQMCALKEHLRGKHGLGKPLVCVLCGRSFKYKPQLYDHNCSGVAVGEGSRQRAAGQSRSASFTSAASAPSLQNIDSGSPDAATATTTTTLSVSPDCTRGPMTAVEPQRLQSMMLPTTHNMVEDQIHQD